VLLHLVGEDVHDRARLADVVHRGDHEEVREGAQLREIQQDDVSRLPVDEDIDEFVGESERFRGSFQRGLR